MQRCFKCSYFYAFIKMIKCVQEATTLTKELPNVGTAQNSGMLEEWAKRTHCGFKALAEGL